VTTLALLVCFGFVLAAYNVWCAAKRSTIPLQLSSRVLIKQVKKEKHKGRDDVCLLTVEDGSDLHVDQTVFDKIPQGARVEKRAWERQLRVNGDPIDLDWSSRDLAGMLRAMPLALVVLAATAWRAGCPPVGQAEQSLR
jgi:hypothetical protein